MLRQRLTSRGWILIAVAVALGAKVLFAVALTTSWLFMASWLFFGYLVTFDDFLPGGWDNPDAKSDVPYAELMLRALHWCAALGVWLLLRE